jgi:hypothetical protein
MGPREALRTGTVDLARVDAALAALLANAPPAELTSASPSSAIVVPMIARRRTLRRRSFCAPTRRALRARAPGDAAADVDALTSYAVKPGSGPLQ